MAIVSIIRNFDIWSEKKKKKKPTLFCIFSQPVTVQLSGIAFSFGFFLTESTKIPFALSNAESCYQWPGCSTCGFCKHQARDQSTAACTAYSMLHTVMHGMVAVIGDDMSG